MSTTHAYEQYFGLKEHAFSITPDPRFVYLSNSHRAALERLNQGAAGGSNGFVLLTGDVGTGKTTICRTFLERLPPKTEVVLILNPILTLTEFLQTICSELDLVVEGNRESNKNLTDHLNRFLLQVYAIGHKTILIVDEAQNLTQGLMEQIRLLTNLESDTDKLLQIFLIGQPELRDMLDRPELLQVSQRITSRYHLGPLNKNEAREYIEWRLKIAGAETSPFTPAAIRQVFAFSKGVPRLINVLCDKALLSAYKKSSLTIDGKIIGDAKQHVVGQTRASAGGIGRFVVAFGTACIFTAVVLGTMYLLNLGNLRPWVDAQLANAQVAEGINPKPQAALVGQSPSGAQTPFGPPTEPVATKSQTWTPGQSAPIASEAPLPRADTGGLGSTTPPVTPSIAIPMPTRASDSEPVTNQVSSSPAPSAQRRESHPGDASSARSASAEPRQPTRAESTATNLTATIPADQSLDDYTRRYAERKLLSMWGIADAESTLDFCRGAAARGLTCLTDTSALSGLYRFDRPAILYLTIGEVSSYAVALKASPESVVLDVLGQEHVIPAASLKDVWDGKFMLLWRRPGNIRGNISLGANGQPALWLRRALDQIDGKSTVGNIFDEQLAARLRAFQRQAGLTADGIVGPRTYILLQNKLAEEDS